MFEMFKIFIKLKTFFVILIICILTINCEKGKKDIIPDVYVNCSINTNHFNLGVNTSILLDHVKAGVTFLGYNNNGLVIYRTDISSFKAYDRTCPHHVVTSTPVDLDESSIFVICPECGSKYELPFGGFPQSGPSQYPLKEYSTYYNPNTMILSISN